MKDIPERIQSHIHFTGFVEDDDLPNIYRGANFFVFPSKYEGFGLPPLEAMACGTPVLSSDAASMPEVLGDSAIYFKSDNQQDLVRQLKRMIVMDGKERKDFIKSCQERASLYSWEKSAKNLHEVLRLQV